MILGADGRPLGSFDDLREVVLASGGRTIPLEVWRDGATVELAITPQERDTDDGQGGFERRVMIGVAGAPLYLPATETPAPWTAVAIGAERMAAVIVQSLQAASPASCPARSARRTCRGRSASPRSRARPRRRGCSPSSR